MCVGVSVWWRSIKLRSRVVFKIFRYPCTPRLRISRYPHQVFAFSPPIYNSSSVVVSLVESLSLKIFQISAYEQSLPFHMLTVLQCYNKGKGGKSTTSHFHCFSPVLVQNFEAKCYAPGAISQCLFNIWIGIFAGLLLSKGKGGSLTYMCTSQSLNTLSQHLFFFGQVLSRVWCMDGNMSSVANQSGSATSSMMGQLFGRIWCTVYIVESVSTSSISE